MSRRTPNRRPSWGAAVTATGGGSSSPLGARRWPREVAMFAGAYLLYSLARGVSRGSEVEALENAARVVALQAELGLNVERQVQEWITGLQVMSVLGLLYLLAQLVAVPLALVLVYKRRRPVYPVLRTTLLGAWLVAIPIYALFPTAPPRLAGVGIVDSVTRESLVPLDAPFVEFFYNPVAAVPSMHAAFAVAVGIGLASVTRVPVLRVAALMWGPLVILIVVATGNHFILDVVAGLLVVGVGFAIAVALHGTPWTRPARAAIAPWRPMPGGGDALRVAIMCPYAWDAHGGVAAQVRDMAASLRGRGHQVDILAPADGPIDEPNFHALGRTAGVRHNGSVGRVALSPWANMRAWWIVRRGDYDVVHLHEPLVPPCLSVLLFSGRPMVGTFHMYGPNSRLYGVMAPFARIAVRRLHHRTAVSEAARSSTAKFLHGEFEVIPNGVARHERSAPPRDAGDDGVRILFIGRNDPRKGLGTLLTAIRGLPGVRLDLVGVDRDEVEALQEQIAPGTPLPDGVTAFGRVSDARRGELLDHADILCAPSLKGESFGLVLVEAMSAGVAVVASAIPGYVDVLDGHGRTVPPGDVAALTAALRELADDPGLRDRLGEEGRRAAARFEWDHVTPRVLGAYGTAMAAHAVRRGLVAVPVAAGTGDAVEASAERA